MFFVLFCIQVVLGDLDMELGKTYDGAITPWQSDSKYKLYRLQITEVIPDRDLILVVKQLSAMGNPDIYISTKTSEPNLFANEWKCESIGLDVCVINKVQMTTYHIAVHCEDFCRYQLKAVYEAKLQMHNSDDLEFKLSEEQWTEEVKIEVKEFQQLMYAETKTLEIQVRIRNPQILEEHFVSYLNIGDESPTPEKHDYIGEDTFSGMQKFKINNVKLEQKFTLLVEGQSGAIVAIQTRTYGQIHQIQLGEKIEDIVQDGQFQFYCINLTQDVTTLQKGQTVLNIQLLPFKGYTQMFVNLDYQPSFIDGYYWQLNDTVTDDLVIYAEDLYKVNAEGGLVFVAVKGIESNATYELRSHLFDPNFMVLELNKPATAKLNQNSQIQYKFFIRANKQETVSVSLKNLVGDADIIVKQCKNLWECKIEDEEKKNKVNKVNNTPGKLFLYSDQPGNDIIVFDNIPGECQVYDNTYQCFYAVLIYPGPENKVQDLAYKILVTTKGEQILLRENTPLKQFVGHELFNYYKFIVDEKDQIRRLMIQITPIQGQPKLYVSQKDTRPTQDSHEKQGVQNLVAYGGRGNPEPIQGTFYIGIYGYTASQYIITANVIRGRGDWRQYGKFANQYILLLDGYPHESHTENNTDIQLYKIDLSAYYDPDRKFHQQVIVQLRIIQGEFIIYGFDHPETDTSKAFLQGKDQLILTSTNTNYPQYLYIRVVANENFPSSKYSYQIYYRIDSEPVELVLGNNYEGFISKNQTEAFFISYFKEEDLIISKNVQNHDQSIVTATIFFGEKNTLTLQGQSITIPKDKLEYDRCKTTATEIIKCQISIFVSSKEDTFYSLLVSKDQSIVQLYEGEPVTKPIRDKFDYYTFLLSSNETEISVFSISGEVRILLKIVKTGFPKLEEFPKSDEDSILQSLNDQYEIGSSIFISQDLLNQLECYKDECYAAITCMKSESKFESKGDYTITRSSNVIPLYEGYVYQGEAKPDVMKYFKVQFIPKGQGLMVIATPQSMGSLIVVASQDEMPTLDVHDHSSNTAFGDQLIIAPKEDVETIYIGVYAFDKVKYSIQINIGNTHFYQLRRGVPFNFFQSYNSTSYLNYYHAIDIEFTILLTNNIVSQYGQPYVTISTYLNMNEQSQALLSDSYKWIMKDQYLTINKDMYYCTNCYYLIKIQNYYFDTDITATISMKGQSIHLLDNLEQTNLLQQNEQHFYHYSSEQENFYINATVIKGKIDIYGGFFNTMDQIDKLILNLDENEGLGDEGKIVAGRQGIFVNRTYFVKQSERSDKEDQKGPLYRIKINSTIGAIYKIECISQQQAIELKLGEPQRQNLNGSQSSVFYFIIPESHYQQIDSFYSITIETYGQSQNRIRYGTQFPNVVLQQDKIHNTDYSSKYHDYVNVPINFGNSTNLLQYFEFPKEPGVYFLKITPREYSTLPYTVTLGSDDLNVLPSQLQRFVNSKPGQQRLWEVTIQQPQKLLIQAQLCNGVIGLYMSDRLDDLRSGSYQEKLEYRHNRQIVGAFDAKSAGTFYIGSKAIKGKQDTVSYILRLNVLQPSSILVNEHFEPGEGGDITLIYDKPNMTVLFKPIRIAELSSQDYRLESVSYFMIYKPQDLFDESPISLCDDTVLFPSFNIKAAKYKAGQDLSISAGIDTNFTKLQVTILARVKTLTNNHESIHYDYLYNTETIKQENLNLYQKPRYWRRAIWGIILTVLLMVIAYLLLRNRRLKQSLKYEQSEQSLQQLRPEQAIEMNYTNLR